MGKKSPSAPPAPSAAAMVEAQAAANKEAVRESAKVNSVDIYGPAGRTYYLRNPDGTPAAQFTELNPQSQYIYNRQQQIGGTLADTAYNRLDGIAQTPYTLSGMPYDPRSVRVNTMPTYSVLSGGRSGPWFPGQRFESAGPGPYPANHYSPFGVGLTGGMNPGPRIAAAPAGGGQVAGGPTGGMAQGPRAMALPQGGEAGASQQPAALASQSQTESSTAPAAWQQAQGEPSSRATYPNFSSVPSNDDRRPSPQQMLQMPQQTPQWPPAALISPPSTWMPPPGGGGQPLNYGAPVQQGLGGGAWGRGGGFGGGITSDMSYVPYDPRSYGSIDHFNRRVGDALFASGARRLDPMYERQARELEQTLANRGLPIDGEAYRTAVEDFRRQRSDAYADLANRATMAEMDAARGIIGTEQGLRSTAWNENLQDTQQRQADWLRQLQIGQNLRSQINTDTLAERNQAINEVAAILQGSPAMQMPNAPNVPTYQIASPDVIGAHMGAYNAQMNAYNAGQARNNSMWQGAFGVAQAALPFILSHPGMKEVIGYV